MIRLSMNVLASALALLNRIETYTFRLYPSWHILRSPLLVLRIFLRFRPIVGGSLKMKTSWL